MVKKEKADKIEQLKEGQKVALLSIIVLFLLAILKAAVGYYFHSPLLVADAYHSGADILINFISLLGLWLATRKKSTRFPYGLYRAETMACLLMSGLIIFVGYEVYQDGLLKLFQFRYPDRFPVFPVGAAIISFVVSLVLAAKQKAVGRAIGSQALLATARETFFDIFTSLFVIIGILLVYAGIPYVEGAVIIVISIFIIKLGVETAGASLMILMDANLDIDLQTEIEEKINRIYGVKGVSEVKIRSSGPFKMVECIIETSPVLSLYKVHEMADDAETMLCNDYNNIESVFIHVEPEAKKNVSAIMPVQNIDGLDSRLHGHFGRAPYYIILHLIDDQIEIEDFYLNEFLGEKGHIGLKVVNAIIDYKIDLMFVSKIGEISFHMLKNNLVDIYKADEGKTVKDVVKSYHLKQLDLINAPTHLAEASQFAESNRQKA